MTLYNDRLRELAGQATRKEYLDRRLASLNEQHRQLSNKLVTLSVEMDREQEDVKKLERRSLANFLYNVVGKMDAKLTREREEAYAAAVRYDAAQQELRSVENDIRQCRAALDELRSCDREYEALLSEKAKRIRNSDTAAGKEYLEIERRVAGLKLQKKEVEEAISAGQSAYSTAERILESLNSAQSWGTFDLLGGGIIADAVKHSHLDEAQDQVEALQVQLRRFQTELTDVEVTADLRVNIEGFLRFADYFFDGLFADWTVLDKISQSQSQVERTKNQINDVIKKLETLKKETENQVREQERRRNALVLETEA